MLRDLAFILPDNGEDDIFVHYSAINVEGYKTLKAGQYVSFDTERGVKGLHAVNIQPVETSVDEPEDDPTLIQDLAMEGGVSLTAKSLIISLLKAGYHKKPGAT